MGACGFVPASHEHERRAFAESNSVSWAGMGDSDLAPSPSFNRHFAGEGVMGVEWESISARLIFGSATQSLPKSTAFKAAGAPRNLENPSV